MIAYVGVDPGVGGGMSVINGISGGIELYKLKDATESDIANWLDIQTEGRRRFGVIERVASTPQMGVCSAFTFGRSYGFLRGILIGLEVPFEEVSPQKWQKEIGCLTKGDKNISKAKAQQLFPGLKLTHATADALLLAEYARRLYHLRNGI